MILRSSDRIDQQNISISSKNFSNNKFEYGICAINSQNGINIWKCIWALNINTILSNGDIDLFYGFIRLRWKYSVSSVFPNLHRNCEIVWFISWPWGLKGSTGACGMEPGVWAHEIRRRKAIKLFRDFFYYVLIWYSEPHDSLKINLWDPNRWDPFFA